MPGTRQIRASLRNRNNLSKCTWTYHKSNCVREPTGKNQEKAGAQDHENPAAQTLCDPQQSKCTWISHEATFMREFTAKKAGTRERTLT